MNDQLPIWGKNLKKTRFQLFPANLWAFYHFRFRFRHVFSTPVTVSGNHDSSESVNALPV